MNHDFFCHPCFFAVKILHNIWFRRIRRFSKASWNFTNYNNNRFTFLESTREQKKCHSTSLFWFLTAFTLFSFFANPVSGRALKKSPDSSMFQVSSAEQPWTISGSLSIQALMVVIGISPASPTFLACLKPKHFLKCSNHLLYALKSPKPPPTALFPPRWNRPWRGEWAYLTKRFSHQCINK